MVPLVPLVPLVPEVPQVPLVPLVPEVLPSRTGGTFSFTTIEAKGFSEADFRLGGRETKTFPSASGGPTWVFSHRVTTPVRTRSRLLIHRQVPGPS